MQRLPLFSRVARLSGSWPWCNGRHYCVEVALVGRCCWLDENGAGGAAKPSAFCETNTIF
jgi:hypothetical protein